MKASTRRSLTGGRPGAKVDALPEGGAARLPDHSCRQWRGALLGSDGGFDSSRLHHCCQADRPSPFSGALGRGRFLASRGVCGAVLGLSRSRGDADGSPPLSPDFTPKTALSASLSLFDADLSKRLHERPGSQVGFWTGGGRRERHSLHPCRRADCHCPDMEMEGGTRVQRRDCCPPSRRHSRAERCPAGSAREHRPDGSAGPARSRARGGCLQDRAWCAPAASIGLARAPNWQYFISGPEGECQVGLGAARATQRLPCTRRRRAAPRA